MSTQCCPVKSLCIDPASPVTNFSVEAPDSILFIGFNSGWDGSDGGFNTPSIGGTWDSNGCEFTCLSTVSQADADQCAANQQLACADGGWTNPPGVPVQNALNDPESCTSFCPDGNPFTFAIPGGTVLAQNRAMADEIAASFACKSAAARKICLGSLTTAEVCLNGRFNATITATGGFSGSNSNRWALVAGVLPDGINFVGSFTTGPFESVVTGPVLTISGTATKAGNFPFTIRFTAPNGDFMQKQYAICVIDITPGTLNNASTNTPYSQQLTAPCGTAPLNWQVTSGSLPPGLTLDQTTGLISGTPTTAGTYAFVVTLQTAAS